MDEPSSSPALLATRAKRLPLSRLIGCSSTSGILRQFTTRSLQILNSLPRQAGRLFQDEGLELRRDGQVSVSTSHELLLSTQGALRQRLLLVPLPFNNDVQNLQHDVQVARAREHALWNVLEPPLKIPAQLLAQLLGPPLRGTPICRWSSSTADSSPSRPRWRIAVIPFLGWALPPSIPLTFKTLP